jgi:hypothetical protein
MESFVGIVDALVLALFGRYLDDLEMRYFWVSRRTKLERMLISVCCFICYFWVRMLSMTNFLHRFAVLGRVKAAYV